MGNPQIRIRD
uniref:Uncharacterized protein n=1 Tax=Arundo donax TaxID=35708 RepID=A0A0A9C994_ARUDO